MDSSAKETRLREQLNRACFEHQVLDRITLSQFQITLGVDDIEFVVYTQIVFSSSIHEKQSVLQADWRERNDLSFDVCKAVGHAIEEIHFTTEGLKIILANFGTLILRKVNGSESYYIHAPRAGGTFIY